MTNKSRSLDAAKKAVRRAGSQQAPSVDVFVPEIRSNIKWKPTTLPVQPFRPEAVVTLVWSFGLPFKDIDGLHDWLATHEVTIATECAHKCATPTGPAASYLGTYMHLDTGSPRYQTFWGLNDETTAEDVLKAALANNKLFRDLVMVLRGYWSRDPGASDHRYGLARRYINTDTLGIDSAFWNVTRASKNESPI